MALIRSVIQHPTKKCWAYVEYSDENKNHCIVLGGKEFDTQEDALEYSKGFEIFSYEWKEQSANHSSLNKMSNPKPKHISFWEYINKTSPVWLFFCAVNILMLFLWGIHEIKQNGAWNVMVTAIVFIVMIPTVFYAHYKRYLKGKNY